MAREGEIDADFGCVVERIGAMAHQYLKAITGIAPQCFVYGALEEGEVLGPHAAGIVDTAEEDPLTVDVYSRSLVDEQWDGRFIKDPADLIDASEILVIPQRSICTQRSIQFRDKPQGIRELCEIIRDITRDRDNIGTVLGCFGQDLFEVFDGDIVAQVEV